MPQLDKRRAALLGRIGGFARAARDDPREYTAPARSAFLDRFTREVDPDGLLPLAERERRASAARARYMSRLALASVDARRAKAARSAQSRAAVEARDDDADSRSE